MALADEYNRAIYIEKSRRLRSQLKRGVSFYEAAAPEALLDGIPRHEFKPVINPEAVDQFRRLLSAPQSHRVQDDSAVVESS